MAGKSNHIEIKSERFVLKTLAGFNATPKYLTWLAGSAAKKYITYAEHERTIEELRLYIDDKSNRDDVIFLGVFLKDGLLHIGNIKYEPVNSKKHYAVMGIMIGDQDWQGKGVGPEVIKISAMWLHLEKGINQIVLGVDVGNVVAIKAYKKIGFRVHETPYIHVSLESQLTMVWDL